MKRDKRCNDLPDLSRAFGRADKAFVYRVEATVASLRNQEEKKKMSKKIPVAVIVIALILLLSLGTAVALGLGWNHIEQAMDVAVESGFYENWSLETKIKLIEAMKDDGLTVSEQDLKNLKGNILNEREKTDLADTILTDYYGEQEYLYYYTMAVTEWGEPQTWTLEQRYWFYKTQREKGLYKDDYWIDLLPEKGDMTQQEAEQIAKRAVAEAYDLKEADLENYHGNTAFFVTEDYDIPRWMVELYEGDNVYAVRYTVLLTRDGQVTEDPEGMGIYTPEHERQRREEKQEEAERHPVWEEQAQAWLNDGGKVYYNPKGGKNYHFIPDCPLVKEDYLPLTALDQTEEIFQRLTPCPGCVQRSELWPVEEKIKYGAMYCAFPEANWISEEKAVEIARKALEEQGFDLRGLYPVVVTGSKGDEEPLYAVYFASVTLDDMGFAVLDCRFSATLKGETGEVIAVEENTGNG